MKKLFLFMLLICFVKKSSAGIYRHDVPVERYRENAAQKQFDCVGIMMNHRGAAGSCVLIGSKYVLSAAHCFVESETKEDTMMIGKTRVIVYGQVNRRQADVTAYQFRFGRKHYNGKTIKFFPAFWDKETEGSCDIAVIELTEEVIGISPAAVCQTSDELNSVVTGVGFGVSGRADDPEDVGIYLEKIAGENIIDTIEGYELDGCRTTLSCDFDHPTIKGLNKMGAPEAQPLEYISGGGDSGGGLFRQKDGTWELVGICTGAATDIESLMATGYYGQTMHWTRVSAFVKWIQDSIKNETR